MVKTIAENIGIDISKAHLDVAAHSTGEVLQFTNNAKGYKLLAKWLGKRDVKSITFEATGPYHRGLERFLSMRGLGFARVNPYQARCFAEATGKLAKTDPLDALMLARFGAVMQPAECTGRSHGIDLIGELVCARRALVKDRTAARNRQHNLQAGLLKRQTIRRLR